MMDVPFLERASYWTGISAVVFGAMAAVLALAAWYFSTQLADGREKALNSFKASATAAIASADARAADANLRAAEARESASKAEHGTAKALADAAAAAERTQRFELATEEQRERAAKAERDLLQLQERLRARTVPADVMQKLIQALGSVTEKGPLTIAWVSGDAEAAAYGAQFLRAFTEAGWKTESTILLDVSGFGMAFAVSSEAAAPKHAGILQTIFQRLGLPHEAFVEPKIASEGKGVLFVGSKQQD